VASEAGARKGIPNPIGHAALGVVLAGVTALAVILATLNRLDSLKQTGPRLETPVASILRDVNPTIEVFQLSGPR
jgi:hypothetical protein